jgi:uncharacterized membrane protein (UPF0127 family)
MKFHRFVPALIVLAAACANASGSSPLLFPGLEQAELEAVTKSGTHRFKVWIAADDRSREQGLMRVRELPSGRGMLFLFDRPQPVAFWMKDTYLSLDIIFITQDGRVLNVARHARPLSLVPIESDGPVTAVLELLAGTAEDIALQPGDLIVLPSLRTTSARSEQDPIKPPGRPAD